MSKPLHSLLLSTRHGMRAPLPEGRAIPCRLTGCLQFASNPHGRDSRFRTVNENIVNYYRPWNASERGGAVRADYTRYAVLVNNTMPGPSIVATVNQTVDITVINHLMSDTVAIHWHGIRQVGKRGCPTEILCARWFAGSRLVVIPSLPPHHTPTS